MKKMFCLIAGLTSMFAAAPEYTKENQLIMPKDYREWVFLSSGLGMTYGPAAESASNTAANPFFDNVFVSPAAYRAFMQTGKWPDKTVFVLEVRSSTGKGSINNGGHYQSDFAAIEAEVKDEARFPGKWAFFAFGKSAPNAKAIPTTASCYSCHSQNGAVDNTFVQFYPTLLAVAKTHGTVKAGDFKDSAEESAATVVDLVCNMPINPKTAAAKSEYKGKTYHFCSQDCKDNFDRAPEQYVKAAAGK